MERISHWLSGSFPLRSQQLLWVPPPLILLELLLLCCLGTRPATAQPQQIVGPAAVRQVERLMTRVAHIQQKMQSLYDYGPSSQTLRRTFEQAGLCHPGQTCDYAGHGRHQNLYLLWHWNGQPFYSNHRIAMETSLSEVKRRGYIREHELNYLVRSVEAWEFYEMRLALLYRRWVETNVYAVEQSLRGNHEAGPYLDAVENAIESAIAELSSKRLFAALQGEHETDSRETCWAGTWETSIAGITSPSYLVSQQGNRVVGIITNAGPDVIETFEGIVSGPYVEGRSSLVKLDFRRGESPVIHGTFLLELSSDERAFHGVYFTGDGRRFSWAGRKVGTSYCDHNADESWDLTFPINQAGENENRKNEEEEDICDVMRAKQEKTTSKRLLYKPWIKKLICAYVEADFTSYSAREQYVQLVLQALRANVSGPGGLVSAQQNIQYVVTNQPAEWNVVKKQVAVRRITKPEIRRSHFQPDRSVIGLPEGLNHAGRTSAIFHTPTPATEPDQLLVIPKAETAILIIFWLKKVADLLNEHPEGLDIRRDGESIGASLKRFHDQYLSGAQMPTHFTVPESAVQPKPTPREVTPLTDGMNKKEIEFAERKGIRVKDVEENSKLGITEVRHAFAPVAIGKVGQLDLHEFESIEPYDKIHPKYGVIVIIRTYLQLNVGNGVPRKNHVWRVYTNDGKRDLTPVIEKHEMRHVNDTWTAWKTNVLDELAKQLETVDLQHVAWRKVIQKPSAVDGHVFIDVQALYIFESDVDPSVVDATKELLRRRFNSENMQKLREAFKREYNRRAEAFHATPEGQGLDGSGHSLLDGRGFEPKMPEPEQLKDLRAPTLR